MDEEREPTRSELLDQLYNQVVALQDKLTLMFAEALACEQAQFPQHGELQTAETRQALLERLHDTSQQLIQAMAAYHVAYSDWVLQFEQETFEAVDGQQALQDLLASDH